MRHLKQFQIFESYLDGKIFCYHCTGHDTSKDWRDIIRYGFKINLGKSYGPGLYTHYDLEDARMWGGKYYPVIIEFEIQKFDGFYVESPEISLKMFGKYDVRSQIENIMGSNWVLNHPDVMRDILRRPKDAILYIERALDLYQSELTPEMQYERDKSFYGSKLKGWILDSSGNSTNYYCVIYDISIVKPSRFSIDRGESWYPATEVDRFQYIEA
jgi:hypothetical protein